jgi:hypothetical protein
LVRGEPRGDRTTHLKARRGIDVQPEPHEGLQHGRVGARLHREAYREPVRVRESERLARLLLEIRLAVHERGRAVRGGDCARLLLGHEAQALDGGGIDDRGRFGH